MRPSSPSRGFLPPLLLLAATAAPLGAQEAPLAEPISTDRPDFTEGVATVQPGRFQLEGGYSFTRDGPAEEHSVGELLVRIGLMRSLEARVGVNSFAVLRAPRESAKGLEDLALGGKLRLRRAAGRGAAPALSLVGEISLPTGADGIGSGEVEPSVLLASAWGVSERVGVGSNLGYRNRASGPERVDEAFGSLALGVELADRLGAFLEYFGFFPDGRQEDDSHFLDAGLTLGLGPDAQLDGRGGIGLDAPGPSWFAGVGLSWRR